MRRAAGHGCGAGAGTAKARTRASHRSCGRVSHTMVRARAGLRYKRPGAGRGGARRVTSARSTSSPAPRRAGGLPGDGLLGGPRSRGRDVPRRSAPISVPSPAGSGPFDGCLVVNRSRAQARGERSLVLTGSQGCPSRPFRSLIGVLGKEVALSL